MTFILVNEVCTDTIIYISYFISHLQQCEIPAILFKLLLTKENNLQTLPITYISPYFPGRWLKELQTDLCYFLS